MALFGISWEFYIMGKEEYVFYYGTHSCHKFQNIMSTYINVTDETVFFTA